MLGEHREAVFYAVEGEREVRDSEGVRVRKQWEAMLRSAGILAASGDPVGAERYLSEAGIVLGNQAE